MAQFEFEWEKTLSRSEVAALLRELADGLDDEGEVELKLDSGKIELDVPDELELEIEYEAEEGGVELEIELSWSTSGDGRTEGAEIDLDEKR